MLRDCLFFGGSASRGFNLLVYILQILDQSLFTLQILDSSVSGLKVVEPLNKDTPN